MKHLGKAEAGGEGRLWTGLVLLLVLGACGVKFYPFLISGGTRPSHDWGDIHQTDAFHLEAAWAEGDALPFWSPFIQGGCALFAVPTKPMSYPPFIAGILAFGPFKGMNFLLALHVALGAIGMFFLARRLRTSLAAACASALFFALTIYPGALFVAAPFWGYAIGWWPFVFLCLLQILERPRWLPAAAVLGLLLSLQFHSGGIFPLYWLGCFVAAFLLPYLLTRDAWRIVKRLAAAGLSALAVFLSLSAVKLLPVLNWIETSGRSEPLGHDEILYGYEIDLAGFEGIHPGLTILKMMLVEKRDGLIALGVAALLGIAWGRRQRAAWGALAGTTFCLLIATGILHGFFYDFLPGYNRMRMPYRFVFPAGLGFILLAAYGVELLWQGAARLRPGWLKGALVLLIIGGILAETRSLPFVRFRTWKLLSYRARERIARPVFDAMRADAGPFRFHYPDSNEQSQWIPRKLMSTSGLLGGGGSANREYMEWLPAHDASFDLEAHHRGVLDVLNTRYIAALKPMSFPDLVRIYTPESMADEEPVKYPDAFAARVKADGTGLEYCGYIGGDGEDLAYGITVDGKGRAHVTGHTASSEATFPVRGGVDGSYGGCVDAFVTRVSAEGDALESSTYLGGDAVDWGVDIEVNESGSVFVTGQTQSLQNSFPVRKGLGQVYLGGQRDAFLAKLGSGGPEDKFSYPLPLPIVENRGQAHEEVLYYVQGGRRSVFFNRRGITYLLWEKDILWALKLDFLDANPSMKPEARKPLPGCFNFLWGPPEGWIRNVPSFWQMAYLDCWPGVDVVFKTDAHGLKTEFVVNPGADPGRIRLGYRGVGSLEVTANDRLIVKFPAGTMEDAAPAAYQEIDGKRVEMPVSYALENGGTATPTVYGFELGGYDSGRTLVIDPAVLLFCGYLGGMQNDMGKAVTVRGDHEVFVAGQTLSARPEYPTDPGPFMRKAAPESDAFVAKVDARNGRMIFHTALGGKGGDFAQAVAVDGEGRVYITGSTRSDEESFPVTKGPDLTFNGEEDAYVARLAPDGASLDFCGYIGGAVGDYGQGVAVDSKGRVYVCGDTKSSHFGFPVARGPDVTYNGSAEGFAARVAPDGMTLDFCGYIGGKGMDIAYDIALDGRDRAYVAGVTSSDASTFPVTVGPDLTHNGGEWDAYVAKLAADGSGLDFCGYIGGDDKDIAFTIAADDQGRTYVAGTTRSEEKSFPVARGPDLEFGLSDYTRYRMAHTLSRDFKPFVRPFVYLRKTCLERASVVKDAVCVTGEEAARRDAIRHALSRPDFDARRRVYIEMELLDEKDASKFSSVVFAGSLPGDHEMVQWKARMGGRMAYKPNLGAVWEPGENKSAGREAVAPLTYDRLELGLNRIEVDLEGAQGSFLLLSEVMPLHPGWRAEIDGKPAKILRADGLITALELPPGARRATFTFRPPGFIAGAWITGVSAFLLASAWLVFRKRGREAP